MVSIDGCKHLCILRDIDCKINGTVNHQSKALIYKMPEATRTCDVLLLGTISIRWNISIDFEN